MVDLKSRSESKKNIDAIIKDAINKAFDINCTCGKLLAKKKASKIEIKCVKCKQIVEV